ncbi:MAG: hypothetical protein HQL52_17000, partial [Magnetococcales bacterium]|nr:hypothetical protein [Magnetococcales bacterium]
MVAWAGSGDGIVLDGSLNPEQVGVLNPVDGDYAITSDMGSLSGSNLFHSFSEFN